jgi:hypothetical protein
MWRKFFERRRDLVYAVNAANINKQRELREAGFVKILKSGPLDMYIVYLEGTGPYPITNPLHWDKTAASLDIMIGLCYRSDTAQSLYARQLFKGWLWGVYLDIAGRWDILVARRIATPIK